MKAKTIVIIVLVVILAVLVIQNSTLVPFRLLFWMTYMPVFLLVLGVFAVGLIIGYLVARSDRKKVLKPVAVPAEREVKPSPIAGPNPGSPEGPGSPDPTLNSKK